MEGGKEREGLPACTWPPGLHPPWPLPYPPPTILSCNAGGAVFVGELESEGITISRSRFIQNTAFGAGAMIVYASNLTMTDCEFTGNVCVENAGAYFWTQSATSVRPFQQTITNATFRNNTARFQVRAREQSQGRVAWLDAWPLDTSRPSKGLT